MQPFSIAGIQMPVSATESNVPEMRRQLDVLAHRFPWVEMVVFSELAPFGPIPRNPQPIGGALEHEFAALARHYQIWLIPGSFFVTENGRLYNMSVVLDPQGAVVGRYRKMFPFLPYEEGVEPGHEFLVFDVPGAGRFGLSICYDIWFPETTRTMVAMGAEVILHPSLTNTIDRDAEHSICRATAAMNQCYVFDVNGIGDGGYGRSIVVGPQGKAIYQAGSGTEIIPVQLNLEQVRWERENGMLGLGQLLKSFRDRRVDFSVYRPDAFDGSYLNRLGPLVKPVRRPPVEQPPAPVPFAGPAVASAPVAPVAWPAGPGEETATPAPQPAAYVGG